jgi:hypothetical protein
MPERPARFSPNERQLWVWKQARGTGVPVIQTSDPYSTLAKLLLGRAEASPGELVAWWVASDYLLKHQRYKGMGWWHLSGAALSIRLTRTWSAEELLSAAAAALEARGLAPSTVELPETGSRSLP